MLRVRYNKKKVLVHYINYKGNKGTKNNTTTIKRNVQETCLR